MLCFRLCKVTTLLPRVSMVLSAWLYDLIKLSTCQCSLRIAGRLVKDDCLGASYHTEGLWRAFGV